MKENIKESKVGITCLFFKVVMSVLLYCAVVLISIVVSTSNLKVVRRYMRDNKIEIMRNDDLTVARDDSNYYCDIYIFRGDKKIATTDGLGLASYDNWVFPFSDCFYVYKESKKIHDKIEDEKEAELNAKFKRILNK